MEWVVLGAGASGLGASHLLSRLSEKVLLIEKNLLSDEKKNLLSRRNIDFIENDTGQVVFPHQLKGLVLSPGINLKHPYVLQAKAKNLPIWSEVDLALLHFRGKVISITGTNGKSTTVSMIHTILKNMGFSSILAGNIGTPASEFIAQGIVAQFLVLEISSYQLEHSTRLRSDLAVFTNLSPDHIARHGSFRQYIVDKAKIIPPTGPVIMGEDVAKKMQEYNIPLRKNGVKIIQKSRALDYMQQHDCKFAEWHNQLNGFFAIQSISTLLNLELLSLVEHLDNFIPLPHRCEKIGKINGMSIINDSKATNVASTMIALSNQKNSTLLFLGGQSKGESFAAIKQYSNIVKKVVVFGSSQKIIEDELKDTFEIIPFRSLSESIGMLDSFLPQKSDILFSPGCASFDEFNNFEHRGEVFKKLMNSFMDREPQ